MRSNSIFDRQKRPLLMWPLDGRGMARSWPAIRQPPWYIDIVANQVKAAKHQLYTPHPLDPDKLSQTGRDAPKGAAFQEASFFYPNKRGERR